MGENDEYQYEELNQIEHLSNLLVLAKRLHKKNLQIFEAHYDYQHFGSFMLVIGTSKKRLMFAYDGRDDLLDVKQSSFQNQNAPPDWKLLNKKILDRTNPFQEIENQALA